MGSETYIKETKFTIKILKFIYYNIQHTFFKHLDVEFENVWKLFPDCRIYCCRIFQVDWMVGFNLGLQLRSELLPAVWDSTLMKIRGHAFTNWSVTEGMVSLFGTPEIQFIKELGGHSTKDDFYKYQVLLAYIAVFHQTRLETGVEWFVDWATTASLFNS